MDISSSRWWLQIPLHSRCLLPITWPLTYCDVQSPLATTAACNADVIRTTLVDGMGAKRRQIFFCSFLHLTNYHIIQCGSALFSSLRLYCLFLLSLSQHSRHTHTLAAEMHDDCQNLSTRSHLTNKQHSLPPHQHCISREVIYPLRYLPLSLRRD